MRRAIAIIGLCVLLLATIPGCGGQDAGQQAMNLSGIVALVDGHIQNTLDTLEVLAATSEVRSADWKTMEPLLEKADQVMVPGPKWFGLPDGSYYVAGMGKADANIADRAYFPVVMSGKNTYSELVVSRSTGEKVLVVAAPVINGGKVIGAVGTSIFLEDLSRMVSAEVKLPDSMVFYAVTPANEIALHSDTGLILDSNPTEPDKAVFETSQLTGWRFALGYRK